MKKLYLFAFITLLCGCHLEQSGNFGSFFVQQVSNYSGHTVNSNSVPELQGTWSFHADAQGFETHLFGASFQNVQAFMQQVYGPSVLIETNKQGQLHGLYKALDIGVAIQFFGEPNGVGFVCLRGQTNSAFYVH